MSPDPQLTPPASGSGCGMLATKYTATVLGCCACSVAATLVVITGVMGQGLRIKSCLNYCRRLDFVKG